MTTRSWMGVLGVLALGLGAAACAEGPESEGDEAGEQESAIKGARPADAYPEAVLIDMLESGQVVGACSGAMIAPRFVLTAGHCVRHGGAMRVTSPAKGAVAMADLAAPYDLFEDGEHVDPASHDVGLLRLATPIDLSTYPELAGQALADGARVVSVGRIHDGEISFDEMFASRPVKVRGAEDIGFPFAYRAIEKIEPGDSGGPAFVVRSGAHVIAAVSSGAGGGVELLARVDLVQAWIAAWMHEHAGDDAVPGDACTHDVCAEGEALDVRCEDACVASVCEADAYCCTSAWDEACTVEAALTCGACGG